MSKPHKTLSVSEFNDLVDLLDSTEVPYHFTQLACCASIETASGFYDCSLTANVKEIYNIGAISNSFKTTHYDDISGQYGYNTYKTCTNKDKVKWDYEIAYGYAYADEYYSRKWLKCWSYDINSAFAFAMLSPMPDTTKKPRYNDIIRHGEMGFYEMGGATTEAGEYADIIFPLMDSPFKSYIYKYYELKKNAKTKAERGKYKDFLNIPTGLIAKKNIFLRNAILYYSNKYIKSFIDEDTVYCNVDCIVSLRPRYDLPIGPEIGQFKQEHICDDFKYIKEMQYQWGTECHYSGIPSEALTDIEDTKDWTKNLKYKVVGHKIYENK